MRLLPRPTYANVMATAAMFVALGGTSYAVAKLPKGSVGTAQLKKGAVTSAKLAPGVAVSGPSGPRGPRGEAGPAGAAGPRGATGGVAQAEAWQSLPLQPAWSNFGFGYEFGGFRKDASGTVQLRGVLRAQAAPTELIAMLPPGYRPGQIEVFSPNSGGLSDHARVDVYPSGAVIWKSGSDAPQSYVSLSGVFFTPTG